MVFLRLSTPPPPRGCPCAHIVHQKAPNAARAPRGSNPRPPTLPGPTTPPLGTCGPPETTVGASWGKKNAPDDLRLPPVAGIITPKRPMPGPCPTCPAFLSCSIDSRMVFSLFFFFFFSLYSLLNKSIHLKNIERFSSWLVTLSRKRAFTKEMSRKWFCFLEL